MKLFLAVFCAAVCVVYVSGETCTVNSDCVNTSCNTGNTVVCQHPSGSGVSQDGGLCTCEDSSGECSSASDCYGSNANLNCPDSARHCYDNVCICDRFPIGRREITSE
ncbi:hypothetical protein ACF0H5_022314 [Mactra antiquata]